MAEHSARLLIVDDNKVNRLLLSRSVELLGHRIALAENGRVALDKLRKEPFDLLLLDIEMPELDGFAVLEQLKADLQLRDVPVIVTSSIEGLDNIVRCIEPGRRGLSVQAGKSGAVESPHRRQSREEASARPAEGIGAALRHLRGGGGPAAVGVCAWRQTRSRVGDVLRHPRFHGAGGEPGDRKRRSTCSTRITC